MIEGKVIVSRLLSSDVKGDLLVLFRKNPGVVDTVDGVARRIGRVAEMVEEDIGDLVDMGLLKKKRVGSSEVILLDQWRDSEIQRLVADYLLNLKMSNDDGV